MSEVRTYRTEIAVTNSMTESERTRLLEFVSFPEDTKPQEQIDVAAQTPDSTGRVLCWRRRRQCNNPQCIDSATGKPYQFKATDRDAWNCPLCGKDRHCRRKVTPPNRGCHNHGSNTPTGYALPQAKNGIFSKHIKVDKLSVEFERLLASPQLFDISENIAFLKARIAEVTQEYGGGVSRHLLIQMKQNRTAYEKERSRKAPDVMRLRQLDNDLLNLINNGSQQSQVHADWAAMNDQLTRLIASHDQHNSHERLMINMDKAWMMLAYVEETFALGLNILLEIEEADVENLLQKMDINFEQKMTPKEMLKMKEGLREFQEAKRKKILAYANKRFKELAGNSLG